MLCAKRKKGKHEKALRWDQKSDGQTEPSEGAGVRDERNDSDAVTHTN